MRGTCTVREKNFPAVAGECLYSLFAEMSKEDVSCASLVFDEHTLQHVGGAWNLHRALQRLGLEERLVTFVLFSSMASLLGNFGQSKYAAANAALDALAQFRVRQGLRAVSIQWGPWGEQGMASSLSHTLQLGGLAPLKNELGVSWVSGGEVGRFLQRYDEVPPFFEDVLNEYVTTVTAETASQVLGRSPSDLPPLDSPLQELGGVEGVCGGGSRPLIRAHSLRIVRRDSSLNSERFWELRRGAQQGLRGSSYDLAVVGGVNLVLVCTKSCKAGMLSPGGRCKTFDSSADGYARGKGSGAVVLQRVADARAQKKAMFAVVRGAAVNHVGRAASLRAPNGSSQQEVICCALRDGGVEASDVCFVEAHGTGTALGDPIEVGALKAVYGQGREAANPLVVGALKTNFGHLEGAAGIAGFIKLVLVLVQRRAPPNLHLKQLNPHLDIEGFPVVFPTESVALEGMGGGTSSLRHRKLIGGVSSFGFGGANAHVVVEEGTPPIPLTCLGCPFRLAKCGRRMSGKLMRETFGMRSE
uniref:Ketosynthase family 3 (KS3) domain-containing protein n=1 Tax=Chromera velia CCMP2878 TaxID=1169474 RepID=A0A0G4G213_9ALVE|eukprot:Cvel_19874.t1-p1 / transcript=Cvel_19874.t1 / gene=Cvel_19874 / organism=Chromera_velia_CCMP2878 / gene_product=Phthiocerol synthesis polyketide synthase type I, putative / transcript_product=Phthiocerol synthesis polyketide synthase type I, putative / location=Cvel_scaffold1743:23267-26412(+) / protein_length=528 / sequence_SO=supercontig / SO=protein_coding / is_pseudo=false